MAGAGYKTWVDGDILTAADVNTYLMQQAVMRFADAAARTSAIAAPSEGMVTYLVDTDAIEYYDGAAWQPILDQDVIEAKGDLIVGTADDAVARLAVGSNKYFLVADSAETTGMRWSNEGSWQAVGTASSWDSYGAFDFCKYTKIGNTIIVQFSFTLTGTPVGTFQFTQPVSEVTLEALEGSSGSAVCYDASLSTSVVSLTFTTSDKIRVAAPTNAVNATTPFTWASGDIIRGLHIYEVS